MTQKEKAGTNTPGLKLTLILGLATSLVAIVVASYFLAANATGSWSWWDSPGSLTPELWFGIIRNAVTLVGALGLAATLFLSYKRQEAAEKTLQIASKAQRITADAYDLDVERREDAQVTELRSRYAKTAEQLGNSAVAVRIAGVYALASLADDWQKKGNGGERQVCIDVLTAYFRMVESGAESDGSDAPTREAIWRSIFDRTRLGAADELRWTGANVDLRHAPLGARVLSKRILDFGSLHFGGALVTDFRFNNCTLSAGKVTFRKTILEGTITFSDCFFSSGTIDLSVVQGASPGKDWVIKFENCNFSGTQMVADCAGDSNSGILFENCEFSKSSPAITGTPHMGFLKFYNCTGATNATRGFDQSGVRSAQPSDHLVAQPPAQSPVEPVK